MPDSAEALDGVAPPPGQSPVLVVWREYGRRRDRLFVVDSFTAVLLALGAVVVVGSGGLHPAFGFIVAMACSEAVAWLVVVPLATSPRSFYAAGKDWLIDGSTIRSGYCWVRTDLLSSARPSNRRKLTIVFTDQRHRRATITDEALRSCEPLRSVLAAAAGHHWFARAYFSGPPGSQAGSTVCRPGLEPHTWSERIGH